MKRDIETVRDFHQYYNGRYIKGRTPGSVYSVYQVDDTSIYLREYGLKPNADVIGPLTLDQLPKYIYFGIPRVGMFVHGGCLYYAATSAVRSANRGFNLERYRFTNLVAQEHAFTGATPVLDPRHGRHDSAMAVMWPEHMPIDVAWSKLTSGDVLGAALTWNFGVSNKLGYRYPVLWYRTAMIGEFRGPTEVVLDPTWAQYRGVVQRAITGVRVVE